MMATDHAPHSVQDKKEGKPGFSGLEITAPVMIDLYKRNKITLKRIFAIFLLFTCASLTIEHFIL